MKAWAGTRGIVELKWTLEEEENRPSGGLRKKVKTEF